MENENKHPEVGEDITKYGEFISTYFSWTPLPVQKENAEKLAQITKGDKKRKKQEIYKEEKENDI